MTIPNELLDAITADKDGELQRVGKIIGQLYTDHGLPIDMAFDREGLSDLTKMQKIAILYAAQNWLIEHRRNSNATNKALDRQRASNNQVMERFIKTGETGIY